MRRSLVVELSSSWLTEDSFEELIARHDYRGHVSAGGVVIFRFPDGAKLLARVGLRFLSFLNQLVAPLEGRVELHFSATGGLFGYLDRNGFLSLLSSDIVTVPERPFLSGAVTQRGHSQNLVEIRELHPGTSGNLRQDTVKTLVEALVNHYPAGHQTDRLSRAVFTTLAELVDNVHSHSETGIPGYATLQVYERAFRVQIAVSDSGIGIPASLRGSVGPRLQRKSDEELIFEALRNGLSRHGLESGHGCGLPRCAALAAEFRSELMVRTPSAQVILKPHSVSEGVHTADLKKPMGMLQGTHVCLDFRLDTLL